MHVNVERVVTPYPQLAIEGHCLSSIVDGRKPVCARHYIVTPYATTIMMFIGNPELSFFAAYSLQVTRKNHPLARLDPLVTINAEHTLGLPHGTVFVEASLPLVATNTNLHGECTMG
jgi:hypothetical protein